MKLFKLILMTAWCFMACTAFTVQAADIKPSDIAGRPEVFCQLAKEPNPLLLGSWGCVHPRGLKNSSDTSPEPVQYWLGKSGDQYALFFHRLKTSENRIYKGWRKWTVDGDEIRSGAEVRIFVKDGEVFYQWKDDKPTKMNRVEIK